MKIFEQLDQRGRLAAFEIDNVLVGRRYLCRIVESLPGATIVRRPKRILSWFREDEFCEFDIDGARYVAWEPFGDNSRYWIGPDPVRYLPQTEALRDVFEATPVNRVERWAAFLVGVAVVVSGILFLEEEVRPFTLAAAALMVVIGGWFIRISLSGWSVLWPRSKGG